MHTLQNRIRIADLAARLIAEHGIQDYALAKRKAARSLGLPDGSGLPSNDEIDAALIYRQSLYEPEEQAELLLGLRQQALAVMRVFEPFSPSLTGTVASGAVSDHSLIELDINSDSSKDFEQYLVNKNIEFKTQDKGGRMVYLIYSEPADVLVRIGTGENHHGNAGARRPKLNLSQLEKLLLTPRSEPGSPQSCMPQS
ncbi:MAG: hypothetical protein B7Y41_02805 [Hydrogenophilales bacterium 28-61-23]|nr:MAG: hypothetical protein B7Y41_02805 [Hydrogenophilales bacterium 28-61-23]